MFLKLLYKINWICTLWRISMKDEHRYFVQCLHELLTHKHLASTVDHCLLLTPHAYYEL